MIELRPIGDDWQGLHRNHPDRSPFSAGWTDTRELLLREVGMLQLRSTCDPAIVVQLDITDRDLRRDGQLRADTKVNGHAVIVSFDSKHGPLRYQCDRFIRGWARNAPPAWQANLRAVALGLEALRKVDRYGIAARGEQYTGWNAIGSGTPMPGPMTEDTALAVLRLHSGLSLDRTSGPIRIRAAYRAAAAATHPDAGGDSADFRMVTEARDLLLRNSFTQD